MTILTPTLRQSTREWFYWIAAIVSLVLFAIGILLFTGAATETEPLSPSSPTPDGTMALAEVLEQQGVDVAITESLAETRAAASAPDDTTILFHDPDEFLDGEQQLELVGMARHLVLLDPTFSTLQALAPGVNSAGPPDDDPLTPACSLPSAEVAQEISPGGIAFRVDDSASAQTCLLSDAENADDAFSLVRLDVDGTTVSVLGATSALTNGAIDDYGNAAFALTLLGENETLVWYRPTLADVPGAADPAALTPGWLTPVIVLFILTTIAAAVWRGRRFGPLILENLPVVVRASETMEGRARLYQKGSARLRALDALRIGTVSRLATQCGLPSSATVEEVVLGVSAITGTEARVLRDLLVGTRPANDSELVRLSDELLELESTVARAARA